MRTARLLFAFLLFLWLAPVAHAGGPRWVAGANYFSPAAMGTPIVWANGRVSYYLDQGALSSTVSNSQAASMVASAAAVWSNVSTAAVAISQGGSLSEDVNGSNTTANTPAGTGAVLPADAQSTATTKPVAVIFDADGSVLNDMLGPDASDAGDCTQNGVYSYVDSFTASGAIAHAVIVINGLCASSTALDGLLQYELERAFGRLLGLDWSQVNESMWTNDTETTQGLTGWPIMHPLERLCTLSMTTCMPSPTTLRLDDIASLNQLYPVTSANASAWPSKTNTASATITVEGTVQFTGGQGMQGVNVVLTPLNGSTPDVRYTVATVSGAYFARDAGNAVTGATDAQGNLYGRFGTTDATKEGYFVLSGVPLPAGETAAAYQLSIEPVNPLYIGAESVGPYDGSQVTPSGAMQTVQLGSLSAGAVLTQNFIVSGSAVGTATDDGVQAAPNAAAGDGEWLSRLVGYGHTGWFQFHARANRVFTAEALTLDQQGNPSESKAAAVLGMWSAADADGSSPDVANTSPFNGAQVGLSNLEAQTVSDGEVRLAFADLRGDGRPDYSYRARVLYADTVFPARLTLSGGAIAIYGQGFRPGDTVTLNGVAAAVTNITPTLITAVAAPVSAATGTLTLAVHDPQTLGTAEILDGLSYDAQGTDSVRILSAPSGSVSVGVPVPMSVQVVAGNGSTPAANVQVSFTVTAGAATLGCGSATCAVTTNQSGIGILSVTPASAASTQVAASLTNGASVTAEFDGGTPPSITAMNTLYIAGGATAMWNPVAIVLSQSRPVQSAAVAWSAGSGVQVTTPATQSDAAGVATGTVNVGPIATGGTGTVSACQSQSSACATFTVYAVHGELAGLLPVSGVNQQLAASAAILPITLQAIDAVGHPLAGAAVTIYQRMTAWEPPCPATGRCEAAPVLGTLTTTLTSDQNGLVSFPPMTNGGAPAVINVEARPATRACSAFVWFCSRSMRGNGSTVLRSPANARVRGCAGNGASCPASVCICDTGRHGAGSGSAQLAEARGH